MNDPVMTIDPKRGAMSYAFPKELEEVFENIVMNNCNVTVNITNAPGGGRAF